MPFCVQWGLIHPRLTMPTYVLLLEYDGTKYSGWQRQDSQHTIQSTVEQALRTYLRADHLQIVGSGRTDAGVHATGQVAHFRCEPIPVDQWKRLPNALNGLLPASIAVRSAVQSHDQFHARYDAIQRTYHYLISSQPFALDRHQRLLVLPRVDFERMNLAAKILTGSHHFGAFCRTRSTTINRICTVTRAQWEHEPQPHFWRFMIESNRFLHGMVRSIVGTLLEIGQSKMSLEDLQKILASQDRRHAGPSAPAHALVLHHVEYSTPLFQP